MKNTAFFCYNIDETGGLERVTTVVANEIDNTNKSNVTIISLNGNKSTFFTLNQSIKIHYISKDLNHYSVMKKIREILISAKIDNVVVVDTMLAPILLSSSVGLNLKTVGWEHYSFHSNVIGKKRLISRWITKFFFDKVVVLTERDRKNWAKRVLDKSKIMVIENPSPFKVPEDFDKHNCTYALAIGRLRYEKGFDLLIDAWYLAEKKLPSNVKLIIVGEGEEKHKLKEKINSLKLQNSIIMKNFTEDISSYYSKARVYCLSSRTEALPMVLIEALSFSIPLLAFDCYTGPREIIKQGYNGFIIDENDIDSYSEKIVELFTISDKNLANLSHNAYLSSFKYEISNIIDKWNDMLE